jgi:hypothetical protein
MQSRASPPYLITDLLTPALSEVGGEPEVGFYPFMLILNPIRVKINIGYTEYFLTGKTVFLWGRNPGSVSLNIA